MRHASAPSDPRIAGVLALQRVAGNRAVTAIVSKRHAVQRCGGECHDGCACGDPDSQEDLVQRRHVERQQAGRRAHEAVEDGSIGLRSVGALHVARQQDDAPASIVDHRIDVRAQFALLRLFKGSDADAADARLLFADVKAGRLEGIYGDDLGVAAQLAKARATVRWELVPAGQDAVVIDDGASGAPVLVFRESAGSRPRLDAALLAAYRSHRSGAPPGGDACDILDRLSIAGLVEDDEDAPTVVAALEADEGAGFRASAGDAPRRANDVETAKPGIEARCRDVLGRIDKIREKLEKEKKKKEEQERTRKALEVVKQDVVSATLSVNTPNVKLKVLTKGKPPVAPAGLGFVVEPDLVATGRAVVKPGKLRDATFGFFQICRPFDVDRSVYEVASGGVVRDRSDALRSKQPSLDTVKPGGTFYKDSAKVASNNTVQVTLADAPNSGLYPFVDPACGGQGRLRKARYQVFFFTAFGLLLPGEQRAIPLRGFYWTVKACKDVVPGQPPPDGEVLGQIKVEPFDCLGGSCPIGEPGFVELAGKPAGATCNDIETSTGRPCATTSSIDTSC